MGQVLRSFQPYQPPQSYDDYLGKNSQRIAEIWLDEYKEFFYQRYPHLRQNFVDDISSELQQRRDMHCQNFMWYLNNIYTDVVFPNESVMAEGKVRFDIYSKPDSSTISFEPTASDDKVKHFQALKILL